MNITMMLIWYQTIENFSNFFLKTYDAEACFVYGGLVALTLPTYQRNGIRTEIIIVSSLVDY